MCLLSILPPWPLALYILILTLASKCGEVWMCPSWLPLAFPCSLSLSCWNWFLEAPAIYHYTPAPLAASSLTSLSTPIHQRCWDFCKLLRILTGAAEMALRVRILAASAKVMGMVSSDHLTSQTACNSSFRVPDILFWPLKYQHVHTHAWTHSHIYIKIKYTLKCH